MPKVREVLGHVCVETAAGQRKCNRNSTHAIPRGRRHLAVYDPTSGGRKNYCPQCARPILERAQTDLQRLGAELYGSVHLRDQSAERDEGE